MPIAKFIGRVLRGVSPTGWMLIAVSVLTGIGFCLFPWISDDLHFRMPYRLSVLSGERVPLIGQIMHFKNVYLWNNGRIANFTMLMYQFWPGIVRGGLSAFMLWASLRTGLKFMGAESWGRASVWVCGFVLLMPWVDQIYVQDFQLNYLWAGTLGLVLSYMVIRGGAGMMACALMAVLTGVWQEAVGFPVMVGLGVLWLFYPAFRTRRTALVVVLLGVGLVYLYTAQGARLYRLTSLGAFSLRLDILLVYAVVPAVAAVVTLVRLVRRGRVDAEELFMSVSAVVSAMLMLYAKAGPRVGWWGVMAGLMALIMSCSGVWRSGRGVLKIVCGCLVVFTCVHLVAVDVECFKIRRTYGKVLSECTARPGETVFADVPLRETAPLICLQKPYYNMFSHYCAVRLLSLFYFGEDHAVRVVPEELRDFRAGMGTAISDDGEFRAYKGYVVGPYAGENPQVRYGMRADFRRGPGFVNMYICPFKDAEGVRRAWYVSDDSSVRGLLEPVPLKMY